MILKRKTRNISYQQELLKVPSDDQPDNLHNRVIFYFKRMRNTTFILTQNTATN